MGPFLISLLVGLGAGAWVYSKFMNRTGGNTKSSLITAGICGGAIMVTLFIILSFVMH